MSSDLSQLSAAARRDAEEHLRDKAAIDARDPINPVPLERLNLPTIIDRDPMLQALLKRDAEAAKVLQRLRNAEDHPEIWRLVLKHKLNPVMILSAAAEAYVFARSDMNPITVGYLKEQRRHERMADELADLFEAVGTRLPLADAEKAREFVPLARWAAECMRTCQAGTTKMIRFHISRKRTGLKAERMRFESFLGNFLGAYIKAEGDLVDLIAPIAGAVYASNDQLGNETKQALVTSRGKRVAPTSKKRRVGKISTRARVKPAKNIQGKKPRSM